MTQGFVQLLEHHHKKLKMTKWSGASIWLPDLLPSCMEQCGLSSEENLALYFGYLYVSTRKYILRKVLEKVRIHVFPEMMFSYFLSSV